MTEDARKEPMSFDLFSALAECYEALQIEFDLNIDSQRVRKQLERNPVALYNGQKNLGAQKLLFPNFHHGPQQRSLFERAKMKEVDSCLRNEAVRKCLDDKEVAEAFSTGRIVRARWVLTWKLIRRNKMKLSRTITVVQLL